MLNYRAYTTYVPLFLFVSGTCSIFAQSKLGCSSLWSWALIIGCM